MASDGDKVDEMVSALLALTLVKDRYGFRAWKGHDWDAMDRLHAKGYISNLHGKAKSVVIPKMASSWRGSCSRSISGCGLKLGDGFEGLLLDTLRGKGVDVSDVMQVQPSIGMAFIMVGTDGQNSIVIAPGANARLSADIVRMNRERLTASRLILTQLETPIASLEATLHHCRVKRAFRSCSILRPLRQWSTHCCDKLHG